MWMLCNCRNGVSSYEIARATGIAQKSAWFVLQRLRFVLKETRPAIMGETGTPVEMDETFIGGKPKNMHESRRLKLQTAMNGYAEKTVIFGMLERGTRQVRATLIPERQAHNATGEDSGECRLRFDRLHGRMAGIRWPVKAVRSRNGEPHGRAKSRLRPSKTSGHASSGHWREHTLRSSLTTWTATWMNRCSASIIAFGMMTEPASQRLCLRLRASG